MTFWKLKASLMTCGGQNHVIWLQITYIDFKRLIIKLFVAMILHICVCCTSLFFSTRPQKSATLPPFLAEVLLLSRAVSRKDGRVVLFFSGLNSSYFKYLSFLICNVFYLQNCSRNEIVSFKKLLTWNDLALVEKHKLYLCTFSFILSILRKEDQNLIKSVIQFYLRQSRICITKLCNGTNQLTQLQHDNVATKVI